jgi:2',3'-cyclic-nucleotide 2'-phosphodiesterase (5'-nucleotidase family)
MLQSLGNHEFDDGVDGLVPFIDNATFPILASNLDLSKEPHLKRPNLKNSVVFDRGGVKVAVIGYITPDTRVRNYRMTKNYKFILYMRFVIFTAIKMQDHKT